MIKSAAPIKNNQHEIGSNNTNNTPNPNPIRHTPSVFLKIPNIIAVSYTHLDVYKRQP